MVAREGLVGMDLGEIAPPYDHSTRLTADERAQAERERVGGS